MKTTPTTFLRNVGMSNWAAESPTRTLV